MGRLDLGRFKKLYVAIAGAAAMTAYGFYGDQSFSDTEKIQILSAAVGAFLVWVTANGPVGTAWRYAKGMAYGVSAVLALLVTSLPDGLTNQEKVALGIAFLTGAGILSLKNDREPPRVEAPEEVIVH